MNRQKGKKLVDRWMNEPGFREELRRDLEGTLLRYGVKPGDVAWTTLRNYVLYN
jgi:hypothetical protein